MTAGVASAAMDRGRGQDPAAVGRLRRDSICSWTRASLVVLALLALVVAPGTIFAAAAVPDSDLVPVRGFRRLTQTTNDGGVEYLQRAKLTAGDGAADDVVRLQRLDPFVAATESGKGPRGRRLAQANPGPDLHLVADDITDVDAGNLVQSWSDHTGNGLSLSSFVAAPELVDGGNISTGALFNGHKAVRFGESGITGLSLPTSALQLSTSLEGMTVVAVMSTDSRDATSSVPVRPR